MKIHAEPMKAKDLRPGDLFSMIGPGGRLYWSENNMEIHAEMGVVGEKVYIRLDSPCPPEDAQVDVVRLTVSDTDVVESVGDSHE